MKAREKAYEILKEVCLEKRYSNIALKEELSGFSEVDKGFITNVVYGTLQHYRYVRYLWEKYPKVFPREEIALLLDMSLYQLRFMDKVPNYAVVNEAVEIAKNVYHGKFEKFVNAVLQNVLRDGFRKVEGDTFEKLSIETSIPLWMVKMWNKQYGMELCTQICESLNRIPAQCGRVNTLKMDVDTFLQNYPNFSKGVVAPEAVVYKKGNIAHTEAYQKGYVTVQDESAQLVTHMLEPKGGERILDMCAAPGSKTCHIGALMRNKGELIALDLHEHRAELVKRNARRLGIIMVDTYAMDATKASEHFGVASFDRILLDGPCSGYGVMARKSDIKYHAKSEDMDICIKMQSALLDSASTLLKKGGTLVYSTCTLNKKENEKQIEVFLKRHDDFVLVKEETIFPFTYGSDGFYMAKLEKKA